jgi:pimeloyl-ACP methyl ester carboxylesterase
MAATGPQTAVALIVSVARSPAEVLQSGTSGELPTSDERMPGLAGTSFKSITFKQDGKTQLFGWLHPAALGKARRCGVVLCNPFAYDALSIHRSYRVFAEALAAEGYPTLRFDYHGTGDSAGSDADPARLPAWIASIHAAIDTCKQLAAVDEVVIFGLRLGATMAVKAAAVRSDVVGLMLWAPTVSGRKFVRQLRMLHGTSASHATTDGRVAPAAAAFDGLEAAGFRHTAETIADLGAIDMLKFAIPTVPVVLIDRDDQPAEPELRDHWTAAGVDVLTLMLPGYAAMMRDAQYAIVPDAVIDALVSWLLRTLPDAANRPAPPLTASEDILTPPPETADVPVSVRERPVWFGHDRTLWGVIAQPDAQPNALSSTAVILINAGGNHRIGPSRLTVPVARYVASLGCTTLRMDLAGLGDSIPTPGKLPIFDINSVADVRQAIDFLSNYGPIKLRRIVLIGLCSGGFVAMHTAIRDTRVNSQIIMNLPAFEATPASNAERVARLYIKPFRYYAEAFLRLQTWRRALTGGVDVRRIILGAAARLLQRLAVQRQALLARLRLRRDTSIAAHFRALCRRGCRTLVILSASDGAVDEMETHLGKKASKMRREPNFRYVILDGADHTFTAEAARQHLLGTLRGHFEQLAKQKI